MRPSTVFSRNAQKHQSLFPPAKTILLLFGVANGQPDFLKQLVKNNNVNHFFLQQKNRKPFAKRANVSQIS